MTELVSLIAMLLWVGAIAVLGLILMFVVYFVIDYVCDKLWGKPFLSEENRKKWWV